MITSPVADAKPEEPTVLLVEDEILIRLPMAEMLRGEGFNVIEAVDADEALAILTSTVAIDLVMTDVRMPGSMDGIGLAQRVKTEWPGLKIVVASGHLTQSPQPGLIDAFVTKPYVIRSVIAEIRRLIGERD